MEIIGTIATIFQLICWACHGFCFLMGSMKEINNKTLYHGIAAIFWYLLLKL